MLTINKKMKSRKYKSIDICRNVKKILTTQINFLNITNSVEYEEFISISSDKDPVAMDLPTNNNTYPSKFT